MALTFPNLAYHTSLVEGFSTTDMALYGAYSGPIPACSPTPPNSLVGSFHGDIVIPVGAGALDHILVIFGLLWSNHYLG